MSNPIINKDLYISGTSPGYTLGQIIESGSNSNGNYIKFGNGVMIQWTRVDLGSRTFTQHNSAYPGLYTESGGGNYAWTYPVQFSNNENVVCIPSCQSSAYMMLSCGGVNRTRGVIYYNSVYPFTTNLILLLCAIGTWR